MKYLVGLMMITMLQFSTAHAEMTWTDDGKLVGVDACEKASKKGHLVHQELLFDRNLNWTINWYRLGPFLYAQSFQPFAGPDRKPRLRCREYDSRK